jgi:hypothetical protein
MGRSNGEFPEYQKVEINPDIWPSKYWDRSRQCKYCKRKWPNTFHFKQSPCCYHDTEIINSPPDLRWPEATQKLLESRFEEVYIEWNEGISDEKLEWEDIKTNGEVDEAKVSNEVSKLIDESSSKTLETNRNTQ